jgi:transcriptional regulator NrdR family protein
MRRKANAPKLTCPYCQHLHSLVRDSRTGIFRIVSDGHGGYKRIRKCVKCGWHYTTTENVDPVQDGRINSRNRNI